MDGARRASGVGQTSLDSEAFKAIEANVTKHYQTITLPTMSTGATDMSYLRAKGMQCFGVGPMTDVEDGAEGLCCPQRPGADSRERAVSLRPLPLRRGRGPRQGALNAVARTARPIALLVSQRLHRIQPRGAVGRDEAGAERDERQRNRRRREHQRIPPLDLIEQALRAAARRDGDSPGRSCRR